MNDVLQCPKCELRFISDSELQQHIAIDHPDRSPSEEEAPTEG